MLLWISGLGLLHSHPPPPPQDNESSNSNEMNMVADNGDANIHYCYMNNSTGSESKNHNSIDCTKKRDEISTNRYLIEKWITGWCRY